MMPRGMGTKLARVLRVGVGEGHLALALFLVMALTAAGAGAGATAADALLFARFGVAQLPLLYLALGLVSFVAAVAVSTAFASGRRERVYGGTLVGLVVALVALRALVASSIDVAYPVLWLGASVVAILQGIVAWGVASWLCDARQAKRLFPMANAAKILGSIVGAAAVAPLVRVVRLEDLLILWAFALAATFAVVRWATRDAPGRAPAPPPVPLRDELMSGFRIVRASPLLRSLAVALVLFSVLYFSLALPFTRAARAALPSEDELASFLGIFNATTTGAAFLASLVVANRFYARFGVVNAILGFTLIYLGGFVALALTDSFAVVAAARWIQLAWLAGMADAAYQALFTPVPEERRDQMRAFMEGVPGQAGIALAGLLLLIGDQALDPRVVALGGAVAAAITTAVVWRAREAYREALLAALRAGRPEPFLGGPTAYVTLLNDRASLDVVCAGLASPDVVTRRVAAQILAEIAPAQTVPSVLPAARDPDPLVRAGALRAGARLDAAAFVDAALASRADGDAEVRAAAHLVLARAAAPDGQQALASDARSSRAEVRLATAHVLGDPGFAGAASLLELLARDTDVAVRRAAYIALARVDRVRAIATAEDALARDGEADVALGALEATAASTSAAARAFAVRERERALRYAAAVRGLRPDGEAVALVRLGLANRARHAARRAVRAGAIASGRVATPALLDGLASSDSRVRAAAIETLEAYVRPDLARPLLPIWEGGPADPAILRDDDDPWVRGSLALLNDGGDAMAISTVPLIERVLFLRRVPLFADLDPVDLHQIARIATERSYADGAVLARQAEAGDRLYLIMSGAVRVEQDGRAIATRGAGDAIGELAILDSAPRMATLVVVGDTRVLEMSRADFEAVLRDRPETALGVIRVLSARLREASARAS